MAKYKQIYIGVDQSYQNTGISIVADGKLLDIKSVHLDKYKNNSERRGVLRLKLEHLINVVAPKAEKVTCICEKARLHGGPTSFINIDAIKAMGALTATIVDVCAQYDIDVYSVDTRCWKSQVVGTSKPQANKYGVPEEKWPTVRWVCRQGFENKILIDVSGSRKTKGTFVRDGKKLMYNNDAADSAGIAMFGVLGDPDKLQIER
ncbi:MAG: hypothetical protein KBT03_03430 [Bacteroidales bacterium]|nr:hypothetical protein [Candidatus Scybalousia scybalohippi]